MKPIGYYVSSAQNPDSNIIQSVEQRFGSYLQNLTADDKAAVQVCLIESAICPQQVLIEPNFFTSENAGEFWEMVEQLSPDNQLALSVAIANFLLHGGQG